MHVPDGGLLVDDDGVIRWCGSWSDRPKSEPAPTVVDHHGAFLVPGFVDAHLHFPQMYALDSHGGGQLLEWLDHVVFPAEARFADPSFAQAAADDFCRRLAGSGTTTSLVFGSQFPSAQNALFEAARRTGLRMVLGRTTMTVGPPSAAALLTSEADAIALVRDEIDHWHPRDPGERLHALLQVAVVPRFALSVTPRTLTALGDLYDHYRDDGVYFTSHLAENNRPGDGEVATVLATFEVRRYLDVFDGPTSFLGRRSVLAHAVHCSDAEFHRLAATQSSVAHCPVSQEFLGSGTLPWRRAVASGVTIAIGSDIAAGDEWFIPRVLNASFKAHHGESGEARHALHPAELLFTATLGGARALDLEDRIGNFDTGKDADFCVIDPGEDDVLASLLAHRQPLDDPTADSDALLFTLLMSVGRTALTGAYVRGHRLEAPEVVTAGRRGYR